MSINQFQNVQGDIHDFMRLSHYAEVARIQQLAVRPDVPPALCPEDDVIPEPDEIHEPVEVVELVDGLPTG